MTEKVDFITAESKMITVTNRAMSRKRAAENAIEKIKTISRKQNTNYIHIEDNVLEKLIAKKNKPPVSPIKRSKRKCTAEDIVITEQIELRISKLIPNNGIVFTLREAFTIMDNEAMNPSKFYDLACTGIHKRKPRMGCSRMTLYRRYNKYKNDGILPIETDCGAKMGELLMIEDSKIALLNSTLS